MTRLPPHRRGQEIPIGGKARPPRAKRAGRASESASSGLPEHDCGYPSFVKTTEGEESRDRPYSRDERRKNASAREACANPEESGFYIIYMFTGIITETGITERVSRRRIRVRAKRAFMKKVRMGTSISVDGACLTAAKKHTGEWFEADLMPETVARTNLGALQRGRAVNLELPATPSSFLSGHIVQGHVDGVGKVTGARRERGGLVLSLSFPPRLSRYIAEKGSVAINGVSLTVIETTRGTCAVGIIPHTATHTNLGALKKGDAVNIETDVIAKYLERLSYSSVLQNTRIRKSLRKNTRV